MLVAKLALFMVYSTPKAHLEPRKLRSKKAWVFCYLTALYEEF